MEPPSPSPHLSRQEKRLAAVFAGKKRLTPKGSDFLKLRVSFYDRYAPQACLVDAANESVDNSKACADSPASPSHSWPSIYFGIAFCFSYAAGEQATPDLAIAPILNTSVTFTL